jgi:hypothetical protein
VAAKSQLVIELIAQNMAAVRSQMDGLTGSLRSFEKGTQGLVKGAAFGMGAGVVVAHARSMITAASDVSEAQNKVNQIFGESAVIVTAQAETASRAMGLSKLAVLDAAGAYGNIFTAMGLSREQAAAMSVDMTKLASDMASFNNIGTDAALEKIRAGLVGEAEPLRTVGVLLNEAAVKAEAYRAGIAKQGAELTEAQKVQARYNLILQQTAVQQGDFTRTADGMANANRSVASSFANIEENLGTGFLSGAEAAMNAVKEQIFDVEDLTKLFPITLVRLVALSRIQFARIKADAMGELSGIISAWVEIENAGHAAARTINDAWQNALTQIEARLPGLAQGLRNAAAFATNPMNWLPGVGQIESAAKGLGLLISPPNIQQSAGGGQGAGAPDTSSGAWTPGTQTSPGEQAAARARIERMIEEQKALSDYEAALDKLRAGAGRAGAALASGPPAPGVAGGAKQAKTALEELGISASTIRSALDILGFSAEEQTSVLIALGVAAIDAGPLIEGLGITVDKLAEALNRAGLAGNDLAQRVPGLIAAHKEQEKAAREAEEAERKLAEQMKAEAEELGRYIAEALKGGKDATAGTQRYFEQLGLKKLEEEINGYARRIQDAMREGADPAPILAEAEAVFGRYRDELKRLADGEEMEKLKQSIRDLGETWSYVDENAGTAGMKKALERAQQTARAAADEARDIASSEAANNVAKHMAALAKDNQQWQLAHEAKQQALQDERNTLASQLQIQESITKAAERESAARAQMAAAQRRQSGIMALARGLVGLGRFDALGNAGDNPDATNPLLRQLQAATDILTVIANKTGQTMDSFTVGNLTGQTMSREASLLGAAGMAFMH